MQQTMLIGRRTTRVLARLRSRIPVLFVIPGVLAGQMLSFGYGRHALLALAMLVALAAPFRRSALVLSSGLLAGSVSALAAGAHAQTKIVPNQDTSYLMEVLERPRFPRPGGMRLVLELKAAMNSDGTWRSLDAVPSVVLSCRAVHLPWKNASLLRSGDLFAGRARFYPFPESLPLFSTEKRLQSRGYWGTCRLRYSSKPIGRKEPPAARLRGKAVTKMRQAVGNNERSGLLLSMAIGTRDVLSTATEDIFKRAGLSHLLVLSGYQITLVYYTIYNSLRFLFVRVPRLCLLLPVAPVCALSALLFSCGFVVFAGVEASSARAALALLFVVTSSILEQGGGLGSAIAISFILLALVFPGCYLEPGVQLTYAALIGIYLSSKMAGGAALLRYLFACWVIAICTSIVTTVWFGQLSLAGLVLNPILGPLVAIVGCQGVLISFALYLAGLDHGAILLNAIGRLLELLRDLLRDLVAYPWACPQIESRAGVVLALTVLLVLIVYPEARRAIRALNV